MSTKITSVAIVNSTIDGTPIGLTTRAQGLFGDLEASTLEVSGNTSLLGVATAPTPVSSTDNSTNVATTAWVQGLVGGRSIVGNGYTYLPGGLLLQWGHVTTDINGGQVAVSFPTPFPHAVFAVLPVTLSITDRITYVVNGSVTTSGFTVANNGSSGFAYWMAVGN